MNSLRPFVLLAVGTLAGSVLFHPLLSAKPPAPKDTHKPAATPTPAAAPNNDDAPPDPLARWLLEQDGQPHAIVLSLAQVVHAATGKRVLPFDAANPADAAFLAKLGTIMDRVLPRLNRPDSPAHAAARLDETDEIAARFEDEILAAAHDTAGAFTAEPPDADFHGRGYPAIRLKDTVSGKTYYLAVTLYPTGKREEATRATSLPRALRFDPTEGRRRIADDGCCLLIGVEHNDKKGNDLAFLNWDVTDAANLPVRLAVAFDADGADVYRPGAVLTDGRKGSD